MPSDAQSIDQAAEGTVPNDFDDQGQSQPEASTKRGKSRHRASVACVGCREKRIRVSRSTSLNGQADTFSVRCLLARACVSSAQR